MTPSWYERYVLPYLIDLACGMKPIRMQREKIVPLARGRVLEIGIGTGLNLPYYDKARVERVVGLDPAVDMHRLARKRMLKAGLTVELVALAAEEIPFDSASFDSVVCTYTLCSIPEPIAALKEMRRVLKPGAPLLFCEHGLAPDVSVQRWQRRLNPLWARIGGGCQLTRDVPALLQAAGLRSPDLQTMYLPGPRPLTYNYWGTATG
ncbi:MAG TPA: class I SAM-dependent methyltransferase [Burkholderiales bacterium]